jgi:demethylmenaquinone methyltransferase/2-methoxy-6-polyprenyl-1,4-benzoquinol methylase
MFHAIAPSYDFLNHLLSLNLDKRWRRKAVERLNWERVPDGRYLDLCAGTLDLAATLARRPGFTGLVVGSDFVPRMLQLGQGKAERIVSVTADALDLPHPDATFDGATVGFGVRNLMDLDAGLREAARVLKPGARFVILEMSIPPGQPLRGLFLFYFRHVLPNIGRLVSRHSNAYTWLPESVLAFPEPHALGERMARAGFRDVTWGLLFGGICALHVGTRA